MIPFEFEAVDYQVKGYLGKPDIAKASRYYMITLLNGRNVYMPKVQGAIKDAYNDKRFNPNVDKKMLIMILFHLVNIHL